MKENLTRIVVLGLLSSGTLGTLYDPEEIRFGSGMPYSFVVPENTQPMTVSVVTTTDTTTRIFVPR